MTEWEFYNRIYSSANSLTAQTNTVLSAAV